MAAENTDYSNDIRLRISPNSGKIIVEELKRDGAISFKEISPIDLYFMLNESYRSNEVVDSGLLPEHCLSVSIGKAEKTFVLWNPELRADMTYGEAEYRDGKLFFDIMFVIIINSIVIFKSFKLTNESHYLHIAFAFKHTFNQLT